MILELIENIINETSLKKAETELKTNYSKEEFLKDTENDQYLTDEDKQDIISRNNSLEMFNKSGSKLNKNEIKEIISSSSLIQDFKSAYQSEGEYIQRLNDLSLENNLNIFIFLLYLNERNLTEDEINDIHILFTNMNKEKNNLMNKVFAKNGLTSKPANEIDIDKIISDLIEAKITLEANREEKNKSKKNKEQITNVVMLKGSEINGKIWVMILPKDGNSSYKRGTVINPNEIDYSQGTAACSAEGKYAHHCGNEPRKNSREMLISLRSKTNLKEVFVTMALDYNGNLIETQGNGNNEPNWNLLANNFTYLLDNNVIRKISFKHFQYKIENSFFVFKLKGFIPNDKFNSYMNNENLITKFDKEMLNLIEDNKNKSEEEIFKDIFEFKFLYGKSYIKYRFNEISISTMKFLGYDQEMLLTKYRKQFLELIKKDVFYVENMAVFDNKLILDQEVQDIIELKDGGVEFLLKHVVVNLNKKVNLKTLKNNIILDKYIFDKHGNIIFDGNKHDIENINEFDDKYYQITDTKYFTYLMSKETLKIEIGKGLWLKGIYEFDDKYYKVINKYYESYLMSKETLKIEIGKGLELQNINEFDDKYYKVKDKEENVHLLNKETKEIEFEIGKGLELKAIYPFDDKYYKVSNGYDEIWLLNKKTLKIDFGKGLKVKYIFKFDDKYYKVEIKDNKIYLLNKKTLKIEIGKGLDLLKILNFDDKYYKVEDINFEIYLINKETKEILFKDLELKNIYPFDDEYFKVKNKVYNMCLLNKETKEFLFKDLKLDDIYNYDDEYYKVCEYYKVKNKNNEYLINKETGKRKELNESRVSIFIENILRG